MTVKVGPYYEVFWGIEAEDEQGARATWRGASDAMTYVQADGRWGGERRVAGSLHPLLLTSCVPVSRPAVLLPLRGWHQGRWRGDGGGADGKGETSPFKDLPGPAPGRPGAGGRAGGRS